MRFCGLDVGEVGLCYKSTNREMVKSAYIVRIDRTRQPRGKSPDVCTFASYYTTNEEEYGQSELVVVRKCRASRAKTDTVRFSADDTVGAMRTRDDWAA